MAHTLQSASPRHPVAVVTSTSDGASISPRSASKPNGDQSIIDRCLRFVEAVVLTPEAL